MFKHPLTPVIQVTQQLLLLSESNLSLAKSMDIIIRSESKEKKKLLIIKEKLEKGVPFFAALNSLVPKQWQLPFPSDMQCPNLNESLKKLHNYYKKKKALNQELKQKLRYPIVLSLSTLLLIILICNTFIPSSQALFLQMNVPIPNHLSTLFALCNYLNKNPLLFLSIILAITAALAKALHSLLLKKSPSRPYLLWTLALLLDQGIPLSKAMQTLSEKSNDNRLKQVYATLNKTGQFTTSWTTQIPTPLLYKELLSHGEKSSQFKTIIEHCATALEEKEFQEKKQIIASTQPLLILLISILIAYLLWVMQMPMLTLIQNI